MKKIYKYFVLPIAGITILAGCQKPNIQDDTYTPTINTYAVRNAETWNAECTVLSSNLFDGEVSIIINRYNDIGEKREEITMIRIPLVEGLFGGCKLNSV